jgi:hypothetical protein
MSPYDLQRVMEIFSCGTSPADRDDLPTASMIALVLLLAVVLVVAAHT